MLAEFRIVESELNCYPAEAKEFSDSKRLKSVALSMADIKDIVCAYFGVGETALVSDRREPCTVMARYIGMYFCYRLTEHSSTRIGVVFRRDHSTVLYGMRKVAATENQTIKRYVGDLTEIFNEWPRNVLEWKYTCRKINGHT